LIVGFLFFDHLELEYKRKKKHINKFQHQINIYYFLNITDELIKKYATVHMHFTTILYSNKLELSPDIVDFIFSHHLE